MKKRSVFWGILFIIASILLISTNLKGFDLRSGFNIVVSIILIGILIESIIRINFFGIIFPIAFIYMMYQDKFKLYKLNDIVIFLAALLLSIGLSIIFKRGSFIKMDIFKHKEKIRLEEEYDVDSKVHFSGAITYVTNKFKTGYLESSFGGVKVYFDKDSIVDGEATYEINSLCSGVELYVPNEWRIVNGMNNILSGIGEEGRNRSSECSYILRLTGTLKFSGVTIKYI